MRTSLRLLFSVRAEHAYADERVAAMEFVVPASTARSLRRGRLTCRVRDGRLHVLMAANAAGGPLSDLSGTALRFGLRPRAPREFANVTAPAHGGPNTPLYRSTGPALLAAPIDVRVVGATPRHELLRADRPATVSILDGAANEVWRRTVADAAAELTLDLRLLEPGRYQLRTVDAAGALEQQLLLEPELADCFAVVEIGLDAALYAAESTFAVQLAARNERLRYYIAARNGGAAALSSVAVDDVGHVAEARPRVAFARIEPAAFTSEHLPAAAFAGMGAAVLLCESTTAVPRRHPGRRRIQLSRNGDVLVPDLPSVGADRPASDLIVPLPQA